MPYDIKIRNDQNFDLRKNTVFHLTDLLNGYTYLLDFEFKNCLSFINLVYQPGFKIIY